MVDGGQKNILSNDETRAHRKGQKTGKDEMITQVKSKLSCSFLLGPGVSIL